MSWIQLWSEKCVPHAYASYLHVLLPAIISCSWYADVDSTNVQESPLLACALVALSCSFRCLCYPISPVGFLCQCSHFPATQGSSASCHCFLFLGCCCKSRVNCCSGVPVAGCCSMVHVGHCCESDVDKVPVVGIFLNVWNTQTYVLGNIWV